MPIFLNSRYAGLPITTIRNFDGELKKYLHLRNALTDFDVDGDYIVHTIQEGEMLDLLAYQYYKNEQFWWILAEVNALVFPYDLVGNRSLMIPSIQFVRKHI